ncbi:MAG: hypothetical protein AB1792_08015 [Candidatus Zixiibacteriota bacterium]
MPKLAIPVLVIALLFGGFAFRNSFTQPTTAVTVGEGSGATLDCIVDGVKCKGTAAFFTSLYKDVPGIEKIETYASDHRAVFTYDPVRISPDQIRVIMETPVQLDDGTSVQVFTCMSMK